MVSTEPHRCERKFVIIVGTIKVLDEIGIQRFLTVTSITLYIMNYSMRFLVNGWYKKVIVR
jgi:hypothetical protein